VAPLPSDTQPGGATAFHSSGAGGAVDRDHSSRQAGPPQVPDPLCTTQTPAGRRSSLPPTPLPPGGQPDPHHPSAWSGTHSPQNQQRGRHRRSWLRVWLRWWWPGPPPVTITEETRKALRYCLARERGYIPQPYIPRRPRRIVVLPRQSSAPDVDAPVTGPNAVPYQGATPPRARAHNVG
jgi:hypothetical protein